MRALFTFLFGLTLSCHAIVTRHDVSDDKYIAKIAFFPPLATFYIDGAHGSLITPKWVLTAAHASFCIQQGRYVLINGKPREIKQLYVHPEYKPGQSHDIALVELVNPVLDVHPAALYRQSDEENKDVWFIGIGGTGNGLEGQTTDNAANNGQLRVAQNRVSKANGPLLEFVFDQGSSALPFEGVSGGGDSGGPAFVKSENGYAVLGISSRFTGGGIGKYGITEFYTRVSYFDKWIDNVINGTEKQRQDIVLNKLHHLPAGLSESILPDVCASISVTQSSTDFIK